MDGKVERLVGGLERVDCLGPQVLGRGVVRILKDASFIRAVNKILVLAPRSLGGG